MHTEWKRCTWLVGIYIVLIRFDSSGTRLNMC